MPFGSYAKDIGSGAISGATTGMGLGGPWGALGGGLLGGALGLFGHKGKREQRRNAMGPNTEYGQGGALRTPSSLTNIERFNPQQKQFLDYLNSALTGQGQQAPGGLLNEYFSPEGFEKYAAPYEKFFSERLAPSIAEQFSGAGAGAQRSSAFQQQLAQAAQGVTENLAQNRTQQALGMLPGFMKQYMTPQYNQYYTPEAPSPLQSSLPASLEPIMKNAGPALQQLFAYLQKMWGNRGNSMGQREQYSEVG